MIPQTKHKYVSCRYDYLKITNDTNLSSGKHCGKKTGKKVEVTGDHAVITFHSDSSVQRKGFRILFHIVDSGSNSTTIGIVLNHLYVKNYLGIKIAQLKHQGASKSSVTCTGSSRIIKPSIREKTLLNKSCKHSVCIHFHKQRHTFAWFVV